MKKLLLLLTVVVMIFAACGKDEENQQPISGVPNNEIWYQTQSDFIASLTTEALTNANLILHILPLYHLYLLISNHLFLNLELHLNLT